jgi:group I intron endonuclease
MPDYTRSKIYKIVNSIDDKIYIGSTTKQRLSSRMGEHRANAKMEKYVNVKLYQHMNAVGIDKFIIQLIELFPCTCRDELMARETDLMRELQPALNMNLAFNPVKPGYYKEYYKKHKEQRLDSAYKYIAKNKQKISLRQKQYYENNKAMIKQRQDVKHTCTICNIEILKMTKCRHERSLKHQTLMKNSIDQNNNLL